MIILTPEDKDYPKRFSTLSDKPKKLYCLGDTTLLNKSKICAVIGTRKPTEKAKIIGTNLTKKLVEKNYIILSGLANGCDSIGHKACVENGGKTIAILGTSLDNIWPKENEQLAKDILDSGGLLISEHPNGYRTTKYSFFERDRLQAAGSDKVIVIQCNIDSGTMHTVQKAIRYKKEIYAINPNLFKPFTAEGNRHIINIGKANKIY